MIDQLGLVQSHFTGNSFTDSDNTNLFIDILYGNELSKLAIEIWKVPKCAILQLSAVFNFH